ncbi:BPTD_3080 family restriction endonuclease [Oceanobacter antarcticus]|uniref:DEAD/DEAH box helicase family protein n=1 Tax=Oceanobacter antarcticus TaxID=3133425 RepID=A0ABW8NF82_9GAMM
MSESFFEHPILNSPYEYPNRHWELDESGQPIKEVNRRRSASYITPVPKAKRQKAPKAQDSLNFEADVSTDDNYDPMPFINDLRKEIDAWRLLPEEKWGVTAETARLLKHWRGDHFSGIRPFFCQVEAAEVAIWLTEVAPRASVRGKYFLDHLKNANEGSNPGLLRLALKLATGAGKTTVMALLIIWQTINSVRYPNSARFTKGFLLIAPGITIRDRLRVLLPNDPENYYQTRNLVPREFLREIQQARVVITNYHAFKLKEKIELSKGNREFLQGRGDALQTVETEGQMLSRVLKPLMGMKHMMVINDEAHHCYRERPPTENEEGKLTGDDKNEAKENNEAARLWISGIEAANRHFKKVSVIDLSATPFFLRGSGYSEGTLFPWTMSDFSLMDAIECGIVKLPRVPVADNLPDGELPKYRELWEHIRTQMPKKGRGKAGVLDPQKLPTLLNGALDALYGHYKATYDIWAKANIPVPPCFIVVCNNTTTSKLVYDYISGYERDNANGDIEVVPGKLELFRNYDENGNVLGRPRTLLIDSGQLESGDALDDNFRKAAGKEIELFRREILERTGDQKQADNITEASLLREVMNTVGQQGKLGESIRCVVSVSMLTEGWDANTVTHVLGVRAFGTQLLCEQVMGRALRRQSYQLNEEGKFDAEYADVLGIPFDFASQPIKADPKPPKPTTRIKAMSPERDALSIEFPRVEGYRIDIPDTGLKAEFNDDHKLKLTPELVGPSITEQAGIVGQTVELNVRHLSEVRSSTLNFELAAKLVRKLAKAGEQPANGLFQNARRLVKQWLKECLTCVGDTYPAQLLYPELADLACERIIAGIVHTGLQQERTLLAVADPYNPIGSTAHLSFNTSKNDLWETAANKCHINYVVLDSGWEAELCRVVERHERVKAYVKNHNLGFEVPYEMGGSKRIYIPDFILKIDDGQTTPKPDASGELVEVPDYLNLIVEVKGYRGEDAKQKKLTMDSYWIPGVNQLQKYGRWAFVELTDVFAMQDDFEQKLSEALSNAIEQGIAKAQQPNAPLIATPDSYKAESETQNKAQGEQA